MADGQKQSANILPQVMTTEIAVPYGRLDMFRQFLQRDGRLWNEDMVLSLEAGGDLRNYKDLLRDDHVKSTFEQRRTAVTAAQWSVQPGLRPGETEPSAIAKEAADFVTANLERIGFDDVVSLALFTVFYGFSVSEILWDVIPWNGSQKFQWKAIRVRDRSRFLFTPEGRCYLNVGQADSVESRIWCDATLERPYFWIISTGEDYSDNPYGLGLAHQLYWLVRFKRDAIRWWMVYNEKFAQPTMVGKFPAGAGEPEIAKLLGALRSVLTENGIAIPDNMVIEAVEAKRQGSSDYAKFCTFVNESISKVVLGQTLTTQVGETGGNRALGKVHEGVATAIQKSDADLTCESLNRGPIAWLVQRNFGMDCPLPKVRREIEEKTDLTELATQLQVLDGIGFRPTLEYVQDNWGADFEDMGPPPDPIAVATAKAGAIGGGFPPKKPGTMAKKAVNDARFMAAFSAALPRLFPDQQALDGALQDLGARMASLSADLLEPIVAYADSKPPVEILAELSRGALPQWNDQQLKDAVAQVVFVAKTFGRSFGGRA